MPKLILKIIEDINGTLIFSIENHKHVNRLEAVRIMESIIKRRKRKNK